MSSLKDRRGARRSVTPRITQVQIDVSDNKSGRKSVVWSGLSLPKFRVEGISMFAMGRAPRRPGRKH